MLRSIILFALLSVLAGLLSPRSGASKLTPMSDTQLAQTDAKAGPISFSIERDDLRLFFDTKIETYTEIDRVRLGYYYKDRKDLVTRKGLSPGDSFNDSQMDRRVRWIDHQGEHRQFRVDYGNGQSSPRYAIEYSLFKHDGQRHTDFIPWTDDDYYMSKYKYKKILWVNIHMFVDGVQGNNKNFFNFSSQATRNRNYLDWDINVNNLRAGSSPENPLTLNGLVVRLKYDNITSPNRKLTDIIIGSNDVQGDAYGDFRRLTGLLNPRNAHRSRRTSLQKDMPQNSNANGADLGVEFNTTPIPVILQRDSMLMLLDHIRYYRDYRHPEKQAFMAAVPDNPTHNSANNGLFLRIGLDRNSPHFGYNLVSGYNERVATAFQYRGEHLNASINNWWRGTPPHPNTNSLSSFVGKIPETYSP